ncbi:MAG: heme NO-binding domain-containing protein [Pseudomonadota bacterium]
MRGIVFTEFMDHVSASFGQDMVDDIIDGSDVPSGGVYTACGTYDYTEIVQLVSTLSRMTGRPVPDLVTGFGEFLGDRFTTKFRAYFKRQTTLFDFLDSVEGQIHREVRKLYPDAELPSIVLRERTEERARMRYRSPRGMDDLAVGLVRASARYYGDRVTIEREAGLDDAGPFVDLLVTRKPLVPADPI